jgi:hypothetical protein
MGESERGKDSVSREMLVLVFRLGLQVADGKGYCSTFFVTPPFK